MSNLLRSLLVVVAAGSLLAACGEKPAPAVEAPVQAIAAPVVEAPVAAPVVDENAGGGGYEPTAEERVPGITSEQAAAQAPAVVEAPVAEAAPAEEAPAQ